MNSQKLQKVELYIDKFISFIYNDLQSDYKIYKMYKNKTVFFNHTNLIDDFRIKSIIITTLS